MKEKLLHNIGLKILSCIMALLLWLMIMNSQDPTISTTIEDVPVVVVNEDVVTSRGYGYTIESGETIDVKVKGRRSVVDHLLAGDFRAQADFKTINSMNMATITLECVSEYADELIYEARTDTMAVKLEEQDTRAIGLRVVSSGMVKDGYYKMNESTETGIVQVTGAASQVARVKEVIAEVDLSGISATTTFKPELFAIDVDGMRIDPKKINLSLDTVEVTVKVCPIKTVPIVIKTANNPAEGYFISNIEYAPGEFAVAADADTLAKIEAIELEVPVTGFKDNREVKVDAANYLEARFGERCVIVDENRLVSVLVEVKELSRKTFDISGQNLNILGKDESKYEYKVSREIDSSVNVRGQEEALENLELSDLNVYIDASSWGVGQYTVRLQSTYTGPLQIELGRISIEITEKVVPAISTVYTDDTDDRFY